MDPVLARRSIRKFTAEPVTEEQAQQLFRYAMSAPSAHNQQPWQFIQIDDREILDQVPGFHPYAKMAKEAPMAILVCGDKSKCKTEGFWPQDCSAAVQNILVGAQTMRLGAVWCGVYPIDGLVDAFRSLLTVPEHIVPFAFIVVGHPAEQKPPSERFDSSRIHHNKW